MTPRASWRRCLYTTPLPTAGAAWAASVSRATRPGVPGRFETRNASMASRGRGNGTQIRGKQHRAWTASSSRRARGRRLARARGTPTCAASLRVVARRARAAAFYALGHARAQDEGSPREPRLRRDARASGSGLRRQLGRAGRLRGRPRLHSNYFRDGRPARGDARRRRGPGAREAAGPPARYPTRRGADLPPADDRVAALGDLGEVSSIAAAALREEDPGPYAA